MQGMFERATWPLRKLAWLIEEKLIWPIADAVRGRGTRAAPAAEEEEEAKRKPVLRPDVRIALATVAAAAVVGVAIAAFVGSNGPGSATTSAPDIPPRASAVLPNAPAGSKPEGDQPSTLQGAAPNFQSSSNSEASKASTTAEAQVSPLKGTNQKPSSIPPGVADDTAALHTARDFAGAFVLYEVGRTNAKVNKTFILTATPALARALRDRPPRLPDSVKVPTAKVQNVVIGAIHGREVDASVSLLRFGDLSELRLTLTKRNGAWAVSEVRG
jgi:hypothetical protein